jgi:radical SAM protein with 4Fe4S-binding SPASM domain
MDWKTYLKNSLHDSFLWKGIALSQSIQFHSRYALHYKTPFLKYKQTSLQEINIEFSNQCNLRCKFCALDHSKPTQFIEESTLRLFFDNFLADQRFRSVKTIQLYNAGETLLHPKFIELLHVIKVFKNQAYTQNIAFPSIEIVSNAIPLREKVAKAMVDANIVDVFRISMDGGTPEAFESIRTRAKWDVFYKNVHFFQKYQQEVGGKIQLKTITIVPDDKPLEIDWMDPQFKEILLMANSYELRRLHSWGGEVEGVASKKNVFKSGCNMILDQMILLPNGDVTVCCNDLNSKGVIGNILQNSLYEIYESEARKVYIHKLAQGKKHELELCKDCESY